MSKLEQAKLLIEAKAVLNEMLYRQANGDNQFDEQIEQLKKEWGEFARNFVEETA